jgi:hypothetical protein
VLAASSWRLPFVYRRPAPGHPEAGRTW